MRQYEGQHTQHLARKARQIKAWKSGHPSKLKADYKKACLAMLRYARHIDPAIPILGTEAAHAAGVSPQYAIGCMAAMRLAGIWPWPPKRSQRGKNFKPTADSPAMRLRFAHRCRAGRAVFLTHGHDRNGQLTFAQIRPVWRMIAERMALEQSTEARRYPGEYVPQFRSRKRSHG